MVVFYTEHDMIYPWNINFGKWILICGKESYIDNFPAVDYVLYSNNMVLGCSLTLEIMDDDVKFRNWPAEFMTQ